MPSVSGSIPLFVWIGMKNEKQINKSPAVARAKSFLKRMI
jgi:hypothetical protein